MTSRIIMALTALSFSTSIAGESLAMAVPVHSPAVWKEQATLATPAAVRKKRKLIRKRKNPPAHDRPPQTQEDKPPQTTQDPRPRGKPDRPRKKPRNRNVTKIDRGPAIICIDGRLVRQTCRCADGAAAVRMAKRVLRCTVPQQVRGTTLPRGAAAAAAVAAVQPSGAASQIAQPDRQQLVADEILAAVSLAAPPGIEGEIAQRYGLQRLEAWPINLLAQRLVRYRIPDGRAVDAVLAAMQGDAQITASQPNFLYGRQAKAGDAKPASLQYALAKLRVPAAHALSRGKGTLVAIIDSGIDATHPDLAGIVSGKFTAAGEPDALPVDPHGTEVGGIVGARGAINGVAPEARLLDVRVFDYDGGSEMLATSLAVLRGLDWAGSRKAAVINMSLSGPADSLIERAVSALTRNGAVVVAAAGNGGSGAPAAFPAAYGDVIAVTATDSADSLYAQANHGSYIDVAAPGVDVLSPSLASAYSMTSGTSFAAAHVSGVVALMLSRKPGMTPEEVRRALAAGAGDLGKPGIDAEFGAGLVDALNALNQ
jgi:subtilisin family serine protease